MARSDSLAKQLVPAKALIFRIVHTANLSALLVHGISCANSSKLATSYVSIGNPELIERRRLVEVPIPPYGTLGDYVPFYFTPASPMLLNILSGRGGVTMRTRDEILILVATLHDLGSRGVRHVWTDRHAYLKAAQFRSGTADLTRDIDWAILQTQDFKRDPDDPGKLARYQAEALIHRHMPADALSGIVCYTKETKERVEQELNKRGLQLKVTVQPSWYFQ